MEPIVVQLGQDMPSVIQGARPDVRIEQTAQSTQRYGTLPYIPGPQYTAPVPYAAPYVTMPAMSARPTLPMGYYGQGSQAPFVPNPNWMTEREQLLHQQLLQERQQYEAWRANQAQANPQPQPQMSSAGPLQVEGDVDFSKRSASATRARPEEQFSSKAKAKRAGPSTMEPIVVQLGQDMPSVIQGARPDVRIEQTAQSTQRYGTLPYIPGPQYTAPVPYAAPYVTMPAMSARPTLPMGYYGQGSQAPFVPNPNWMTEREQLLHQQLLQERQQYEAWRANQAQANPQPQPQMSSAGPLQVEGDVDFSKRSASATRARPEEQFSSKAKAKRAKSASTSRRSPSPKRDYPRGICTATRPSQASPKRA